MINWNRHKRATHAAVTFFDDAGKSVGFKRLDRPAQPKTVADAVEQEGEKWTHTWNGRKCKVVFTEDYRSWVKGEGLDKLVPTDSLKPIKPTISESELLCKIKNMAKGVASDGYFGDTVRGWFDDYDII